MLPKVSIPFDFPSCAMKITNPPPKPAEAFAVDIDLFTGPIPSEKCVGMLHKLQANCNASHYAVMKDWAFICALQFTFEGLKLLWFNKHCKRREQVLLCTILTPVAPQRVKHFIYFCESHVDFDNANTYSVFNMIRNSTTVIALILSDCLYYAAGI